MPSENPWYIQTAELAEMLFTEAGEVWLASRTPYISPKTFHEYELNLRTLGRVFGETRLREITADQIRAYDMRHTAITDLLSLPEASEETVKAIAGHISDRILKTYSHIRMDTKRAALAALACRSRVERA